MKISPNLGVTIELTPRQVEILKAYGDGLPTKAIASSLHLSPKTVEFHRNKLYMKLKTSNPINIAKIAIRAGLSSLCLTVAAAQPLFLSPTNPTPQVQLAWTPPNIVGVTNYFVYYGIGSGQYTNKIPVGNVTNTTVSLPARGQPFFFAVTDQVNNLESPFSNEITYTAPLPPAPPTQKPLTVLVVQSSSTPSGTFADAGMNWSLSPDQPDQFYRLKVQKGMILSLVKPPMPKK